MTLRIFSNDEKLYKKTEEVIIIAERTIMELVNYHWNDELVKTKSRLKKFWKSFQRIQSLFKFRGSHRIFYVAES